MSREEAIKRFREQWREMGKLGISKAEYFSRQHLRIGNRPTAHCYLCGTAAKPNDCCFIDWGSTSRTCADNDSLYNKWKDAFYHRDIEQAKKYALLIAELPENNIVR